MVHIDQNRFVTAAKQLPVALMISVESLGVDTIDVSHAAGNIGIRGLDQKMIVVRHQAVDGNTHLPHLAGIFEKLDKPEIITVVIEDGLTASATVQDMIPCVGIFYAQGSRHRIDVNQIFD